jgi:hypothetical protein
VATAPQGFEVFIETLERLGSTKPMRLCLQAMRSREVHGVRFEEFIGRDGEEEEGGAGGAGGSWMRDAAQRDLARDADAAPAAPVPPRPLTAAEQQERQMLAEQEEDDNDDGDDELAAMYD